VFEWVERNELLFLQLVRLVNGYLYFIFDVRVHQIYEIYLFVDQLRKQNFSTFRWTLDDFSGLFQ